MNIDHDMLDAVDLGVASVETLGSRSGITEVMNTQLGTALSDDD